MEYYNPDIEEIYYIQVTDKKIETSEEAYFNTIEIVTIKEVERILKSLGYKMTRRKEYNEHQYALNDILIVSFNNNKISGDEWLGYINIDGCFAAYDKNLEFCYNFIKDINDNIFEVRLFDINDEEIETNLDSLEDFKAKVKEHYADDYENFVDRFGEFDELVMADEDFYILNNAKHSKKHNL